MSAEKVDILDAVSDYLARLSNAEARVESLRAAMELQVRIEGRVAPVTRRAHKKAQGELYELVGRLTAT